MPLSRLKRDADLLGLTFADIERGRAVTGETADAYVRRLKSIAADRIAGGALQPKELEAAKQEADGQAVEPMGQGQRPRHFTSARGKDGLLGALLDPTTYGLDPDEDAAPRRALPTQGQDRGPRHFSGGQSRDQGEIANAHSALMNSTGLGSDDAPRRTKFADALAREASSTRAKQHSINLMNAMFWRDKEGK
jgi:hypothetical protein